MDWQPIETAPKDGTDILVYCGPAHDPMYGVAHWCPRHYASVVAKARHLWRRTYSDEDLRDMETSGWVMWWQDGPRRHTWPTHWMPLPEPPQAPTPATDENGEGEP